MPKPKSHNEYFETISAGGRKSCPTCKTKLESGEAVWRWFEYGGCRQFTVKHFCKNCFEREVRSVLLDHADDCGCTIELVRRGRSPMPAWLTLQPAPAKEVVVCGQSYT